MIPSHIVTVILFEHHNVYALIRRMHLNSKQMYCDKYKITSVTLINVNFININKVKTSTFTKNNNLANVLL